MIDGPAAPRAAPQIRTLARAFLARFFDNDLTRGSMDVQKSFLWMIAALAMPEFILPNLATNRWSITAMSYAPMGGEAYFRRVVDTDLVIAMGMTMASMGLLGAIVWHSLLIDRRDVLVLGAFPVRHRAVLAGKALALAGWFGIISAGMHPLGALFYGIHIGAVTSPWLGVAIVLVHIVVATLAGLFTFLAVIAAQGALLAVAGPRLFERVTPVLQVGLVSAVVLLFVTLPLIGKAAVPTIHALPPSSETWPLLLPPVWFVGLYETLLGTSSPILHGLAARALTALAALAAIGAITYPLAYRRVVAAATTAAPTTRRRWRRRLIAGLPSLLASDAPSRATLQFTLAAFSRSATHRLVLAVAIGIATALIAPILLENQSGIPALPTPGLLAVPSLLMAGLLVGLRIASSLPAELPAAWIFAAAPGDDWTRHRRVVRRLIATIGIGVPGLIGGVICVVFWGPAIALVHTLVFASASMLTMEVLFAGFDGTPCTTPYEPGRAQLQSRWPLYVLGVFLLAIQLPSFESWAFLRDEPRLLWRLAAVLAVAAFIVRRRADRDLPAHTADDRRAEQPAGIGLS